MSTLPDHGPDRNRSASDLAGPAGPECTTEIVDLREALFNEGAVGTIQDVQVSTDRIVQLRGILFDLDPSLLKTGPLTPAVPQDPHQFYGCVARQWLERHPVLAAAEVRNSGAGLHVILRFDEPVLLDTEQDRRKWTGIIKVVQCALPIDPNQPHMTAVTRPLDSINAKNNATVTLLNAGLALPVKTVLGLYDELCASPFRTVFRILTGQQTISPCPFCVKPGSRLSALDYVGRCYHACGNVQIEQLYDLLFLPSDRFTMEADARVSAQE